MAFHKASNFVINNPTFIDTTSTSGGLRTLYKYVARGASHDTKVQDATPKCHPETRTQLLDDIHKWIKIPEKEIGISFLHGPAGAGKSCIARSVCEKASEEGLLGASFFFWRSASDRNNESMLITTIAYQMAKVNDELGKMIAAEIEGNPEIIDMPLDIQFQKLIYDPCLSIPRERLHIRAIIIDGLDECIEDMMQVAILQLLAKAVRYDGFPLGFFVTSRPESHIQEAFNTKEIIFALQTISVDCIAGVSQDIRTVLQSGFARILNDPKFKMALSSVSRPWPSPANIEKLVRRSSRQFIYSATVMKFISSPNRNPDAQLKIVLGIKDGNHSSPLADLDRLYHEILSRVQDTERTMKVLGYVIALKQRTKDKLVLAVQGAINKALNYNQHRLLLVVEQLLDLPKGEAYFALNQLHSVLSLKVGSASFRHNSEIKFHHRSFQDFLISEKRSGKFYLNMAAIHKDIAQSCLKIMSLYKYETEENHVGWIYACFLWDMHAGKYKKDIPRLDLPAFDLAIKRYTVGFHQLLNPTLLSQAFEVLGLLNGSLEASNVKTIRNLLKRGSIPDEDIEKLLNRAIRNIKDPSMSDTEKNNICISLTFPMFQMHLKSYSNDPMIKHVLPLYNIIGHHGLTNLPLDDADLPFGPIPSELTKFMAVIDSMELQMFLSISQYSGTYYFTRDDYTDAFIRLFSLMNWSRTPLLSLNLWAGRIKYLNPTTTPALMASLKLEALHLHSELCDNWADDPFVLYKDIRMAIKKHLLPWLKEVLNPPLDVIKAWERVLTKARSSKSG